MASKNKLKKLKNAYLWKTCLKNGKGSRQKRLQFFTKSERNQIKKQSVKLIISCKDDEENK